MSKYETGQLLITGRNVNISVENEVVEYGRDEVFEILAVSENKHGTEYVIDFGIDEGAIEYTFDEWQIDSFIESDEMEEE